MNSVTSAEREILLQIAEQAISRTLRAGSAPTLQLDSLPPHLQEKGRAL